jgi:diacylglycerol O-acyltransferase / wax synthase
MRVEAPYPPADEAAMEPLTLSDAAWFDMDRPTNPMVITAVLWFDGPVDVGLVRAVVAERLVVRFPRFRQRVVKRGLARRRYWAPDPGFDLDRHLQHRVLPAPGDRGSLQAVVSELMSLTLPTDRPLWAIWVLEGGDTSAVVIRLHHCVADGVSLAYVLASMTDEAATASAPGPAAPRRRSPLADGLELLRHPRALAARGPELVRDGASLARLLLLPPDHRSPLKGPIRGGKRAVWSQPVPLAEIKAVGRALDATVNDVLLAALAGALSRYLAPRGRMPTSLRAMVPFDLRPEQAPVDASLGNRFGMLLVTVPVGHDDPLERLREIVRRTRGAKASPDGVVSSGIVATLGLVPHLVEHVLVDALSTKASLLVTNVPGPREPLTLAGRRLAGIVGWAPASGTVGLSISIFSYAGEVVVGVAADAALVAHPEALVEGFHEELAALGRVASPTEDPRAVAGD